MVQQMRELECIGGPLDGKIVSHEAAAVRLRVPVVERLQFPPGPIDESAEMPAPQFGAYEYRLCDIAEDFAFWF